MRAKSLLILVPVSLALSGCLAKTALDVATAPVKMAGRAVDLATTSQSEADEKRGRQIRQREARLGKLQRQRDKLEPACMHGDSNACSDLAQVNAEIEQIMPSIPVEPDN
jgi:hypothetical protein